MSRDNDTAKFKVDITLTLTPVNRYGDELGGGVITYSKTLEVKNMVELGVYLERLNSKPMEYVQMVEPTTPDDEMDDAPF